MQKNITDTLVESVKELIKKLCTVVNNNDTASEALQEHEQEHERLHDIRAELGREVHIESISTVVEPLNMAMCKLENVLLQDIETQRNMLWAHLGHNLILHKKHSVHDIVRTSHISAIGFQVKHT